MKRETNNGIADRAKDASCRAIVHCYDETRKAGLPVDKLFEGVDYPREHLLNRFEFVDWSSFCRIMENVSALWGEGGMEKLGKSTFNSKAYRTFGALARPFMSVGEFFGFLAHRGIPRFYRCMAATFQEIGPDRGLLTFTMNEGYTPSRLVWDAMIAQGSTLPRLLGQSPAKFTTEYTENGFRALVEYSPAGGKLARVRRMMMSPFMARAASRELNLAQEQLRRQLAELVREMEARKKAEQAALIASIAEQGRIGRDLHDSVGQELTGLSLRTKVLSRSITKEAPDASRLAQEIVNGLNGIIGEIKGAIRGLTPIAPHPQGLMDALDRMIDRMALGTDVRMSFECPEEVAVKDMTAATNLYRIAQEATNNAVKYSNASRIVVRLIQEEDAVVLTIEDDGNGVAAGAAPDGPAGNGVHFMRQRAEAIGAEFDADISGERGTVLRCRWPSITGGGLEELPA